MNIKSDGVLDPGALIEPGAVLTALEKGSNEKSGGFDMPAKAPREERFDVIVIGAGQAGLSVGYHLRRLGVRFAIFEANERIGDVWRRRWDSLRLFTPAKFDGLDGMRFPAPPDSFPTKDEMADYLEAYADRFDLPVFCGMRVDALRRKSGLYSVVAGGREYHAPHVVVAAASYQKPRIPDFAAGLDPKIIQLHSTEYRNPSQLRKGSVLLVGAGNSGAEIAKELAQNRTVWLSGRDVGQIPFKIDGLLGRKMLVRLVVRGIFHRVLTMNTPMGRKFRPTFLSQGGPLIRTRRRDLKRCGVRLVSKVAGIEAGLPRLEDGTALEVENVIWCTGFHPGLSWIDLPIFGSDGWPRHESGVIPGQSGLYFVGLHFLHSVSSTMIHGVGRDARRIAGCIRQRMARETASAA